MADAFLRILLENLNSLIGKKIGTLLGVDKDMKKLSSMVSTICAVLEDAEERQLTDRAIKNWLQKLSDVSFELDNVLDDCEAEAFRLEYHGTWARKVRSSLSRFDPMNVSFRFRMAKTMKEIGERLDEIASERAKFHLRESVGDMRRVDVVRESRQTSSIITQPHVYGRDDDRERIVGFLVNDAVKSMDVSIFTIVGLGGLGKTTLAQLVYNDERVKKHFELKMWVCVSDDFDVKRLVRAVIESASGGGCEALDMDPLQKRLLELLKGKRFLLVLDDVWNEDQEQWDRLKYVLACGSSGSSVVVTTRLKKVASIMGTVAMLHLSGLSDDDCWLLFKQRAFGSEGEERPSLVKIGKEIVKKCKGVPLAAKSLGGLMRYKNEETEWLSVMNSELWNLPEDKLSVLPALRLSYFHLPIEQRRCFAYCAVFPKDHVIGKKKLIQLWMANGLISSKRGVEVEDIGNEIFNELCWRSFLEDHRGYFDNDCVKMHDLVHDLAQSIMEDECCIMEVGEKTDPINLSERVRHLTCHVKSGSKRIGIPQYLRTLLVLQNQSFDCSFHVKVCSLRAFDAKLMIAKYIPALISSLKHLRYLNLSMSNIKILPESVCSLHHLLTLNLDQCRSLQKLPKNFIRLKRLRHLNIQFCDKLVELPPNIGRLTSLKTLTDFIVHRKKGCHLDELCHLNIGGFLCIENLENAGSPTEAKLANLSEKRNLEGLHLSWNTTENDSQEDVEEVLEVLAPSPNLKWLKIFNYKGISFPYWMSNETLGNVASITLDNCQNCVQLPPLGDLAAVKNLKLSQMKIVRFVDNECSRTSFALLESLRIIDLPNLERLSREEGSEKFSCLSNLYLDKCPKLMLPRLESVKELSVFQGTELLLKSIPNLSGLTHLRISENDNIICFPKGMLGNLKTLKSLAIDRFTKLQELPSDLITGLAALETLDISFCHELECFHEGLFESSSLLKHIIIKSCKKLKSLTEGFGDLFALQSLKLVDCPALEGFPSNLNHLSSFQSLIMSGIELKSESRDSISFCLKASHKLAHLPEAFQHLYSLESMAVSNFLELASVPDWLGNLESLRELQLSDCPDLAYLPTSIKRLTNLQRLKIESCPKLEERCKPEVGEDWHKIAHIPDVYVGPDKGFRSFL